MTDCRSAKEYVLNYLTRNIEQDIVSYGGIDASHKKKIHIVESKFWDADVFGTLKSMPEAPFEELDSLSGAPILFGTSDIERLSNGDIVVHADLVAGAFFLLSRYEETINKKRDSFSRFRAEYSIVFKNGYGHIPIVDAYSAFLERLAIDNGFIEKNKNGGKCFKAVLLTHDMDQPFRYYRLDCVFRQWIKNFFHIGKSMGNCLKTYITQKNDPYDTFDEMIKVDNELKRYIGGDVVKTMYFVIAAKAHLWNNYCPINTARFKSLLERIKKSGAEIGLHIGLEAGKNSKRISREVKAYRRVISSNDIKSRNHYLRWVDPNQVTDMEAAGIKEDYTLGYPDHVGFRVGTCFPYHYINPSTCEVTDLIIHPLEIMEATLDGYMHLEKDEAYEKCKEIIDQVFYYGGELDLLWHNTSFFMEGYRKELYMDILRYIRGLYEFKTE